jgi:hypothetical protein
MDEQLFRARGPGTYRCRHRLDDIVSAIAAVHAHLQRGGLSGGLVFDAVRTAGQPQSKEET